MAKPVAPLFSLNASGPIDGLTMSIRRGTPYTRQIVTPHDPLTTKQQWLRNTVMLLGHFWKTSPTLVRDPWEVATKGSNLTALNSFLSASINPVYLANSLRDLKWTPAQLNLPKPTIVSITRVVLYLELTVTPPSLPPGYTLAAIIGAAVADSYMSIPIKRTPFANQDTTAPYIFLIGKCLPDQYYVGAWCKLTRYDGKIFYSEADTKFTYI